MDLLANIEMYKTDSGGRKLPIFNRYRPNLLFDLDKNINTDACFIIPTNIQIYPGEKFEGVGIILLDKSVFDDCIYSKFSIREGLKVVGKGIVNEFITFTS